MTSLTPDPGPYPWPGFDISSGPRFYFHSVMVLMEFLVFGGVNLGLGSPTLRMLSAPLEALPVAT